MEDKPWDAEIFADLEGEAQEEVGDDTKRKVSGLFHALQELCKGGLEAFGGEDESGVEIHGGKLGGVFAAVWDAVYVRRKGKLR